MTIDNVLLARRPFRGGRTVACRGVVTCAKARTLPLSDTARSKNSGDGRFIFTIEALSTAFCPGLRSSDCSYSRCWVARYRGVHI